MWLPSSDNATDGVLILVDSGRVGSSSNWVALVISASTNRVATSSVSTLFLWWGSHPERTTVVPGVDVTIVVVASPTLVIRSIWFIIIVEGRGGGVRA